MGKRQLASWNDIKEPKTRKDDAKHSKKPRKRTDELQLTHEKQPSMKRSERPTRKRSERWPTKQRSERRPTKQRSERRTRNERRGKPSRLGREKNLKRELLKRHRD